MQPRSRQTTAPTPGHSRCPWAAGLTAAGRYIPLHLRHPLAKDVVNPRIALLAAAAAMLTAACGGGTGVTAPTIAPARTYQLAGFSPAGTASSTSPVHLSFTIQKPDGKPLTAYRTGSGPHTGVHVIIVRDDLSRIIHLHPPIGPDGKIDQAVRFPAPGRWHVLVDAYPNLRGQEPNFQLADTVRVAGRYRPHALPPFHATQTVDGYRIT